MMGNEPAEFRATGTDDNCQLAGQDAQRYAQQLCGKLGLVGANGCDDERDEPRNDASRNSLSVTAFGDDIPSDATECDRMRECPHLESNQEPID